MKKRILVVLLVLLMLFSFAACGSNSTGDDAPDNDTKITTSFTLPEMVHGEWGAIAMDSDGERTSLSSNGFDFGEVATLVFNGNNNSITLVLFEEEVIPLKWEQVGSATSENFWNCKLYYESGEEAGTCMYSQFSTYAPQITLGIKSSEAESGIVSLVFQRLN